MTTKLIISRQREAVARDAARGATAGGVPTPPVTGLLNAVGTGASIRIRW